MEDNADKRLAMAMAMVMGGRGGRSERYGGDDVLRLAMASFKFAITAAARGSGSGVMMKGA